MSDRSIFRRFCLKHCIALLLVAFAPSYLILFPLFRGCGIRFRGFGCVPRDDRFLGPFGLRLAVEGRAGGLAALAVVDADKLQNGPRAGIAQARLGQPQDAGVAAGPVAESAGRSRRRESARRPCCPGASAFAAARRPRERSRGSSRPSRRRAARSSRHRCCARRPAQALRRTRCAARRGWQSSRSTPRGA